MQAIILLIIIAIAAAVFGVFQGTPESPPELEEPQYQGETEYQQYGGEGREGQTEEGITEPSLTPNPALQTYIKYGPRAGEILEYETEVTFGFSANIPSDLNRENLIFETKVVGLETSWQSTDEEERTIELPSKPGSYIFMVRARIGNQVDPTPTERSFGVETSSYFEKVTISDVEPPAANNYPSLITLEIDLEGGGTINLTGWEIEGKWGKITIPQGIENFDPQTRPLPVKNILVRDEDTVYLSSASNPLGGKTYSFRTNKCMGYLKSSYDFTLPIENRCPGIQEITFPSNMTEDCRNYLLDLDTCERAKSQELQELNLYDDTACIDYIDANLNYGSCYRKYQWDGDFSGNEWHIYLDRIDREILDYNKDTVYLRDGGGYLVDQYSYGD